ncbi:MAG: hypothetical protein U9N77_03265 [Thermodesulfobacteriota bacterium]|nr:hypothetical protein [Thermodesulfobacteriota bacterium]
MSNFFDFFYEKAGFKEDSMEIDGVAGNITLNKSVTQNRSVNSLKRTPCTPGSAESNNTLTSLGRITDKIPTVSELIVQGPFKQDCWKIVFNEINSDKFFKKITPGTEIFINSKTREVSWGKKVKEHGLKSNFPAESGFTSKIKFKTNTIAGTQFEQGAVEQGAVPCERLPKIEQGMDEIGASRLVNAVSKYIGRDYSKMDCYEMVVKGLKSMGIKYQGRGGLGEHLIRDAVDRGFAYNHFLNGEGLVSQSGKEVFKKSILHIRDADMEADALMQEINTVLKQGQILSFSTRTKGHTGVISKKEGVWTFINSGNMDNNLAGVNGNKAVGEEDLEKELKNWFRLAKNNGHGLKITLGIMDMEKLAMFRSEKRMVSEKV